jgi:hypothetical protein
MPLSTLLISSHRDLKLFLHQAAPLRKFKAVNANYKNITHRRLKKYFQDIDEKISQYFKDLNFYDQQEESTHKKVTAKELKKKIKDLHKKRRYFESKENELDTSCQDQISLESNNDVPRHLQRRRPSDPLLRYAVVSGMSA